MLAHVLWGPIVGALIASGWWAMGMWGFPSATQAESWRTCLATSTMFATFCMFVLIMIAFLTDLSECEDIEINDGKD